MIALLDDISESRLRSMEHRTEFTSACLAEPAIAWESAAARGVLVRGRVPIIEAFMMNETLIKLVAGAILGGIVTLALNVVRIVSTSVAESQKPRLELLRLALEGFNEATYVFGLIGREQGLVMASKALNLPEYDEARYLKYTTLQDEGMRHLSNAIGYALAIGHSGIAGELRGFQNVVFEIMTTIKKDAALDEYSHYQGILKDVLQKNRDTILRLFEIQLREEALLSTAAKRYFGG